MKDELQVIDEGTLLEAAMMQGDLAQMSPQMRVVYYRRVCESVGLNPFTRPFEYIVIKGKLTLYPTKSCAEQLRNKNEVCIDDLTVLETDTEIIVTVKGHDKLGRKDVEIGAVSKKDMEGNLQYIRMKAMTKAKRRLSLSLCGLGWLDAKYNEACEEGASVTVDTDGEIVTHTMEENMKALGFESPKDPNPPAPPAEVIDSESADPAELSPADWYPQDVEADYQKAIALKTPRGTLFGKLTQEQLKILLASPEFTDDQKDAAKIIMAHDFGEKVTSAALLPR
jgi:hypothetical protein